ncbi:hypothetical protein [Mesorhizobium sp. CN2-181]
MEPARLPVVPIAKVAFCRRNVMLASDDATGEDIVRVLRRRIVRILV